MKILILLSTYNGQKYIREQLDSLYNQKGVDIHILVRDDGSKDNTVEILKEYQQRYGKMTIHTEENIGPAKSFHTLMKYAYKEHTHFDYYSFCDQDDVWLEDKLFTATQLLSANNGDLYYCNATITDQELNKVEELGVVHNLSLQYLMFRQPALGCTQVMTSIYFRLCAHMSIQYINKKPFHIELHDAWTMWISQMTGAKVIIDDDAHMLYRQHNNNVTTYKKDNLFQKIRRVASRAHKHSGAFYENLSIIHKLLNDKITPNASFVIGKMLTYKNTPFETLKFAFYMQKHFREPAIKFMVIYYIINRLY